MLCGLLNKVFMPNNKRNNRSMIDSLTINPKLYKHRVVTPLKIAFSNLHGQVFLTFYIFTLNYLLLCFSQ